jgi:hypothetical protein
MQKTTVNVVIITRFLSTIRSYVTSGIVLIHVKVLFHRGPETLFTAL